MIDGDWADVGDKIYRVVSMAALLFGHSRPIDQVCTHNQIHRTEKLRLPRHANFSFIVVAIPCAWTQVILSFLHDKPEQNNLKKVKVPITPIT
jgi:hypothetical protein